MTRVCHVLDDSAGWVQRVGVTQLVDRLPADRYTQWAAAFPSANDTVLTSLGRRVDWCKLPGGALALAVPALLTAVRRRQTDVVHAWGVRAALLASIAARGPLVVGLSDPALSPGDLKRLRTLSRGQHFAIACHSQTVRRRLIEGGLMPAACVVIRPGVDFSLINTYRRGDARERLGVGASERLILVPEPVTQAGGASGGCEAGILRAWMRRDLRVVVPDSSREQQRIVRFAARLPYPDRLVATGGILPFEELVSIADVLIVAPRGDVDTTSVAWAMAARTAIIGSAVYSVAELISHQLNGLLFKIERGKSPVGPIGKLLADRQAQEKCKEAAHGQAFEVFSIRRYVDQVGQLYDNVIRGAAPDEGLTDSAY